MEKKLLEDIVQQNKKGNQERRGNVGSCKQWIYPEMNYKEIPVRNLCSSHRKKWVQVKQDRRLRAILKKKKQNLLNSLSNVVNNQIKAYVSFVNKEKETTKTSEN